ncbi:hypothetical protein C8R45DRAFT_1178278 [Mycena sanguinolenta]|nr:hypothetical protein C8R45DRAFT_1178278 [Mycena sanguinolenta]
MTFWALPASKILVSLHTWEQAWLARGRRGGDVDAGSTTLRDSGDGKGRRSGKEEAVPTRERGGQTDHDEEEMTTCRLHGLVGVSLVRGRASAAGARPSPSRTVLARCTYLAALAHRGAHSAGKTSQQGKHGEDEGRWGRLFLGTCALAGSQVLDDAYCKLSPTARSTRSPEEGGISRRGKRMVWKAGRGQNVMASSVLRSSTPHSRPPNLRRVFDPPQLAVTSPNFD